MVLESVRHTIIRRYYNVYNKYLKYHGMRAAIGCITISFWSINVYLRVHGTYTGLYPLSPRTRIQQSRVVCACVVWCPSRGRACDVSCGRAYRYARTSVTMYTYNYDTSCTQTQSIYARIYIYVHNIHTYMFIILYINILIRARSARDILFAPYTGVIRFGFLTHAVPRCCEVTWQHIILRLYINIIRKSTRIILYNMYGAYHRIRYAHTR